MTIQTAIQLPEETYEKLKLAAEEVGQSPSDFIFQAIDQRLEDTEDVAAAEAILSQVRSGEMKTFTLQEVMSNLGLDN